MIVFPPENLRPASRRRYATFTRYGASTNICGSSEVSVFSAEAARSASPGPALPPRRRLSAAAAAARWTRSRRPAALRWSHRSRLSSALPANHRRPPPRRCGTLANPAARRCIALRARRWKSGICECSFAPRRGAYSVSPAVPLEGRRAAPARAARGIRVFVRHDARPEIICERFQRDVATAALATTIFEIISSNSGCSGNTFMVWMRLLWFPPVSVQQYLQLISLLDGHRVHGLCRPAWLIFNVRKCFRDPCV